MTELSPLVAVITQAGVSKAFAAQSAGISARLAFMAFGSGVGNVGYSPTGREVSLKSEFLRFPIGSGDRVDDTLFLQGLSQAPHATTGWVAEIGLFTDDGTLFAVYSEPNRQVTYVGQNDSVIQALTLGLTALPAGSVSWTVSGPSVNILLGAPLADNALAILGLQRFVTQIMRDVAALKLKLGV